MHCPVLLSAAEAYPGPELNARPTVPVGVSPETFLLLLQKRAGTSSADTGLHRGIKRVRDENKQGSSTWEPRKAVNEDSRLLLRPLFCLGNVHSSFREKGLSTAHTRQSGQQQRIGTCRHWCLFRVRLLLGLVRLLLAVSRVVVHNDYSCRCRISCDGYRVPLLVHRCMTIADVAAAAAATQKLR
jgi:hypothetical protein